MTYRPPAIIVDIDGTMAHRTDGGEYICEPCKERKDDE